MDDDIQLTPRVRAALEELAAAVAAEAPELLGTDRGSDDEVAGFAMPGQLDIGPISRATGAGRASPWAICMGGYCPDQGGCPIHFGMDD